MDYIAIIHKDADSDFGVSFPDFPGCITVGRSLDEAKDMAAEALAGHIEIMQEAGESIPVPSALDDVMTRSDFRDGVAFLVPVKDLGKTVRVNITLRERELAEIDRLARAKGISRSAYLVQSARSGREPRLKRVKILKGAPRTESTSLKRFKRGNPPARSAPKKRGVI